MRRRCRIAALDLKQPRIPLLGRHCKRFIQERREPRKLRRAQVFERRTGSSRVIHDHASLVIRRGRIHPFSPLGYTLREVSLSTLHHRRRLPRGQRPKTCQQEKRRLTIAAFGSGGYARKVARLRKSGGHQLGYSAIGHLGIAWTPELYDNAPHATEPQKLPRSKVLVK